MAPHPCNTCPHAFVRMRRYMPIGTHVCATCVHVRSCGRTDMGPCKHMPTRTRVCATSASVRMKCGRFQVSVQTQFLLHPWMVKTHPWIKLHPQDKCGRLRMFGQVPQTDIRNGCPNANFHPKTSIMTTLTRASLEGMRFRDSTSEGEKPLRVT